MTLPSPKPDKLKQINTIFYKFLWGNGPDKVKREIICQDYQHGGLKMIEIHNFIKGLKVTWIRRLMKTENSPWFTLFENQICTVKRLQTFGKLWICKILNKVRNPFWCDILKIWQDVVDINKVNSNIDILNSPIWYNHRLVEVYPFYLPNWYNSGIKFVHDVVKDCGKFLEFEEIKEKFNNGSLGLLEYYRLRGLINNYIAQNKLDNDFHHVKPFIPFDYKIVLKSKKGSQDFYKLLTSKLKIPDVIGKWNSSLNTTYNVNIWKVIFKSCFLTLQDNNLKWFQFRLLHRILGVNSLLYKMKISDNHYCRLCNSNEETIVHLFVECQKSNKLWGEIKNWINKTVNVELNFTPTLILLGHINSDSNQIPINAILMTVKYYIFNCAHLNKELDIFMCQKRVKNMYMEQQSLSLSLNQLPKFRKKWTKWEPMVTIQNE